MVAACLWSRLGNGWGGGGWAVGMQLLYSYRPTKAPFRGFFLFYEGKISNFLPRDKPSEGKTNNINLAMLKEKKKNCKPSTVSC